MVSNNDNNSSSNLKRSNMASSSLDNNGNEIEEGSLSSKMSKTHISPPERFDQQQQQRLRRRKMTLRDDLRVKYEGPDIEKRGTKGRHLAVDANMFRIVSSSDNRNSSPEIHMYSVNFEPYVKFGGLRIKLVSQCRQRFADMQNMPIRRGNNNNNSSDDDILYFYNGSILYLPFKHDLEEFEEIVKKTNNYGNDSDSEVKIKFKYKCAIISSESSSSSSSSQEVRNMLGSLVKKCLKSMQMVPIGQGLYLMSSRQAIEGYDLDVLSGYKTTVLPHEQHLMLTINLSNKILTRTSVLEKMVQEMQKSGINNAKDSLLRNLVGKIVLTRYNNKTYRIDDLDFERSVESRFEQRQKDGTTRSVSFAEYFRNTYNLRITDMKQPLLISRVKRMATSSDKNREAYQQDVVLIPEFCYLTGIPDEYITDFRFKKAMQSKIRQDPSSRRRALDEFIKSFHQTASYKELQQWGFILDRDPVEIAARQLDGYKYEFGRGDIAKTSDGIVDFRNRQLYDTELPIKRWALIYPTNAQREAQQFCDMLINKISRPLGMSIAQPKLFDYRNDRDPRSVSEILSKLKSLNVQADMIVLMLRHPNKDFYDYFKKETCLSMGIPSQVLLLKHFRNPKGLMSIITKIAIQMQCKVGGAPWAIHFPPRDVFMIIGMDTYHDSSQKGLSCCAAVASLNNSFTKYTWSTCMLQKQQEVNSQMRQLFQSLLQTFIETHRGLKPTRIILFRDGVGEGQVEQISQYEFTAMQQCLSEMNAGTGGNSEDASRMPKLACLTLSKRIETRFFCSSKGNNSGRNPPSGTVVDQVATHKDQKDFYLVPLESRQGTVTPIHYRLHYNTFSLGADNFQYLAYLLCHMYFNWSGAIKVPAVCQYAHKIAYLVGTSLHANPHRDLKTKLFFL